MACSPSGVVRMRMAASGKPKSWMSSSCPSVLCVLDRFFAPVGVRVDRGLVVIQVGREVEEVDDGPLTV